MNEPSLVHARYEAGALLGQGAQGFVLRVFDREARARPLVAKVWHSTSFDPALLAAEFSLLRRLDVRGLVRAHDWGRDELSGAPFLIEDFVAGVCARDFVHNDENGRHRRLATVLAEVAATLSALHDASFLHGDLKPDHVRVTPDRDVLVLDLGCALVADSRGAGASGFTPAFAAPEVRAGARPSRLSDLFSLGALCWYLATGSPPPPGRANLRSQAPWVPPSLGDLIESLLELHPSDRPASADELLLGFGQQQLALSRRAAPAPIGRERELCALSEARMGVRYLVGVSGSGKSHLLREVATRALMAGRPARRVAFPNDDAELLSKLLAFLRGADVAWPFQERGSQAAPLLLVLDDFHAAPAELTSALEAYRCRVPSVDWLDVVAAVREAPPSAPVLELRSLSERPFTELCTALGISGPARVAELAELSGGLPGWVVAAQGRVPLTRDMVLERAKSLSPSASELLAALALLGSTVSEALVARVARSSTTRPPAELVELLGAGLVARRAHPNGSAYALQVPELAGEIAAALGSFEIAERTAQGLLGYDDAAARLLLNLAGGPFPPSQRQSLLARAVELAQRNGRANDEMEGLFALVAEPSQRSAERLRRLERLTRHAGGVHPRVLAWLAEAAVEQPALLPLARRRAAEQAARSGDVAQARELSEQAEAAAARLAEPETIALCLATRGALALYRADVQEADRALRDAAARLALLDEVDPEERARLEHNLGVVALYRDSVEDAIRAFECSLAIKRRLGDRAGVRSCLLNLGLALARHGSHARAERALDEAIALAKSLGQQAGHAWCLAARADLEIRRGNAAAAQRYVAEASSIAETPPLVAADLCILSGQAALLDGDGAAARHALSRLDAAARSSDATLDAKARLVEAGALLASLPAEPRRAARLAVSVMRSARGAKLPEIEAQARQLLRAARGRRARAGETRYPAPMDGDAELWALLGRVAGARDGQQAPLELLRTARRLSGAERALLAVCNPGGVVTSAWGVDFDGFALAEPGARCDADFLRRAFEARAPLYQRDVETDAGRGARLALPSVGEDGEVTILLLEQRFRAGAFDGSSDALLARLATLGAIATRLAASERSVDVVLAPAAAQRATGQARAVPTTALPAVRARRSFPGIVGTSRPLEIALAKLDGAVDSELPVLIHGETGTGKELFARALHEQGARSRAPLVVINCAAVPESLFEAELFGHARGAFTGADRARPGLIARAEGGTLFLDEIGELPLARQASLLRVLETRRYRAVGSDEERPFDVRIVCATNRDLEAEVERGKFRRDLLFRINVVEIRVPALRERREDIPALVQAFLARSGATLSVAASAMNALAAHEWLGNVRELEHQIQRLALLGLARVERAHLPRALRQAVSEPPDGPALDERAEVEVALSQAGGNITHAARALGLTRHGLKKRMLRLGLRARVEGGGE